MESKPQLGLGEYLRGEREKRHITIEQVASATKINIKLLHALEDDNFDGLPAKPFVRGFVTSYTRYVGLDHREVLARFEVYLDEKSGLKFKRPANAPHIFVEREGSTENSKTWLSIMMAGSIVVAALVFLILKPSFKHHRGRSANKAPITNDEVITVLPPPTEGAPITVPSATKVVANTVPAATVEMGPINNPALKTVTVAETKPIPVKTVVVAAPPAPTPTPMPSVTTTAATTPTAVITPPPIEAKSALVKIPSIPSNEVKFRLIVRALDDAWVKYQVDDRPLQQYTLKKDKVIFVRARTSIRFSSAKPKSLEISNDNREFRPYGNSAKALILPKEAEAQFRENPFVDPDPAYLSTPNH